MSRTSGLPSYSATSIALHWAIALLIIANFALIWYRGGIEDDPAQKALSGELIGLHKSLGLTVLALSLVRLVHRLMNGFPALPRGMSAPERLLARGTHYLFYLVMIGMPLTGYLMSSAGKYPLSWFGIPVPKAFAAPDKALGGQFNALHETIGWALLALLALHVAGALKHHLVNRDGVFARMLPGRRTA